MEKNKETDSSENSGQLNWIDEKYATFIYMIVGVLMLVVVPYGMTLTSGIFNNYVLVINTVFSILLIGMGVLEYKNITKSLNLISKHFPIIIIIMGFITTILYSHFYDTGWDRTLHLYIINITDSGIFHIGDYNARDVISETSSVSGIIIILGGLYEILYRKIGKPALAQ